MKRFSSILLIAVVLLIVTGCSKQENITWSSFGSPITLTDVTTAKSILNNPEEFAEKQVKLKGKVAGVCKGSGCWLELDDGSGHTIITKSLDHSVAVPIDCEGKYVEVTGKVMIISVEETAKMEHKTEHHEPGEEEEGHSCPKPTIIVSMEGVKLGESIK